MRRSSFFWGALLVVLGVLFLLDSIGVLVIDVWSVFWPLLLIVVGLWFLAGVFWRRSAEAKALSIPLKGVEAAEIEVEYGAGELVIDGETAPDELLTGEFDGGVDYDARERGEALHLSLRSPASAFWSWNGQRRWSVGINREIPLRLKVKTGASRALLDLSAMNLSRLDLDTGASETTVTLPAAAGETLANVNTGVAAVYLTVPEGVGAHIQADAGLAEVKVDESRFPRQGNGYASPDFENSQNRVEINVRVGVGSVHVR